MTEPGALRRLPPPLQSRLRSSTVVSSLGHVVEELVCNSVDAGASNVRVVVDPGPVLSVTVADDGRGMSVSDVKAVGARYHTSKLHTLADLDAGPRTLGFRGEALASVADACVLEITSRAAGSFETYAKTLHRGGTTLSCGPAREHVPDHGTIVRASDLFHAHPVRRAIVRRAIARQTEDARRRLSRVALVHPRVAFTLEDARTRRLIFRASAGRSLLSSLADAFGGAVASSLAPVDAAFGAYRVRGYVTPTSHPLATAEMQLWYVNRRFVRDTPLHREMARAFRAALAADEDAKRPRERPREGAEVGGFASGSRSSSRPSDVRLGHAASRPPARRPGYLLCLECPLGAYDVTYDAEKTLVAFEDHWRGALEAARRATRAAWGGGDADSFARGGDGRGVRSNGARNLHEPPRTDPEPPARPPERATPPARRPERATPAPPPSPPSPLRDFGIPEEEHPGAPREHPDPFGDERATSPPRRDDAADAAEPSGPGPSSGWSTFAPFACACCPPSATPAASLAATLCGAAEARPPPRKRFSGAETARRLVRASRETFPPEVAQWDLSGAVPSARRVLRRETVDGARAIAQWDRKVVVAASASGDLLAVDQHAADERVRLETLRAELANGGASLPATVFARASRCPLTASERATLAANAALMHRWGWRWEAEGPEGGAFDASSVRLVGAPAVANAALGPEALAEHLRAVAELDGAACAAPPPALARVLASKACRSAIMFGDALSEKECAALVDALGRTDAPTTCAHGRPTTAVVGGGAWRRFREEDTRERAREKSERKKRRRALAKRAVEAWKARRTNETRSE